MGDGGEGAWDGGEESWEDEGAWGGGWKGCKYAGSGPRRPGWLPEPPWAGGGADGGRPRPRPFPPQADDIMALKEFLREGLSAEHQ